MKGTTQYLFLTLFLISSIAFAQNQSKADSIKEVISLNELSTEDQLEAYYRLSIYTISPESKLDYAEQLLDLAESANNENYIIKAHARIGVAHRFMGNLGSALEYLFKSANQAAGKEEYQSFLAEVYAEISTCYTQNGDSENALLYGSKTINMLRKTDKKQVLALSLLNTGYDYYLIGNYDSAMAYYNESEPLLNDIGMDLGIAYIIGNRALVFWKQGNREKAKEELFRAIGMLEPLGDRYGMADYYNQLGSIYLEENAEQKAIEYTMKGMEMAKTEGLKEQVRDASNLLFQLYRKRGDMTNAISYQTQYYAYKDSIQNLETTQKLANLRTEYEVGQKQAEVDRLLEQKRTNRIIMIAGASVIVLFIGLMIMIYTFYKSKTKLSKQLAQQKEDLEILNETKDKFFSIISHDLRGPVNTLNGLVNVAKIYMSTDRIKQASGMVDKMTDSVEHLIKLLDTLLNWALNQRGHFPYAPEELSVKSLVDELLEMSKEMTLSKNIDLTSSIKDDVKVFADRNSTSTILRNLVSNAIKFTNNDGQITIDAFVESQNGVIKVYDNGVGIPEEKLNQLFNLNENVSTRGTSGESGLGLGLQLVYEFIQLNKGKIEVESEVDKGTTFTVYLPLTTTT